MSHIDPTHMRTKATAVDVKPAPIRPAAVPTHSHDHHHHHAGGIDPTAMDEATKAALATIVSKVEQIRRDVIAQIATPNYMQGLAQILLDSGSFNEEIAMRLQRVDQRIEELWNFLRSGASTGPVNNGPIAPIVTKKIEVIGFAAQLLNGRQDPSNMIVVWHPDSHPTLPGDVELWGCDDLSDPDHMHQKDISDLVKDAVREAHRKAGVTRGERYWCDMQQITNEPVGPASVRIQR